MEELKKALKEKNLVFGTKATIRSLRQGKIKHVLVSANCPQEVKEDLKRYAKMSGAEMTELDMPDKDIGMACKKRFSISVLSY